MTTSLADLNAKLTSPTLVSPENLYEKAEPLSTGLPALDAAVGIGGFPRGRIIEIFGAPSVGKSALGLSVIAQAQKEGMRCYFADAEMTFLTDYAKSLGVDTDKLPLIRGEFAEEYFETIEMLAKEKQADVVVLDSLDACTPRAEIEAEAYQVTMAIKARLVSRFLRRIVQPLKESNMMLVVLNQTRVDLIHGTEYTTGGKGLGFYTSLRIKMKQGFPKGLISSGDKIIGKIVDMEVVKNKVAAPNGKLTAQFFFASGFSAAADLLTQAVSRGIIDKRGNTLWFGETKLGTTNKAREFLEINPMVKEAISEKLD